MNIKWDTDTTQADTAIYSLTIRTGMSQQFENRLNTLRWLHPVEGMDVYWQIMRLAQHASSMSSSSEAYPNVPEIMRFERMTSRGEFVAFIIWGIVLTGARKRSLLMGEYRFVMVWEDEIEDALDRVFDLERILVAS